MKKISIYTKDYCSSCSAAKRLLTEVGATFEEIDVSSSPEIMETLVKKSGLMTVPQIFADDICLGGFDDIHKLHEEGKLLEALGM